MTKLLAILTVAVFMLGTLGKPNFPIWLGDSVRASELVRWGALVGSLPWIEPWRHLAAIFVHFNAIHIVFNMMALASFGRVTEGATGSGRFVLIYVATGVVGFVVSDVWYLLWYGTIPFLTAGASGAIFGIIGAQAGDAWARRAPDWRSRVARSIGLAVMLFLLFGLSRSVSVNNAAHFGGLFSGLAFGYAFGKERRAHRRDKLFNGIAAGLLVACVVSVAACNWSPSWQLLRQAEIQQDLR